MEKHRRRTHGRLHDAFTAVSQVVKAHISESQCLAGGLEVMLVQARGARRLRPIEHIAIPPTREQRCVGVVLAGVSGLTERG